MDVAIARDHVSAAKSYLMPQVKISGSAGSLLSPVKFRVVSVKFCKKGIGGMWLDEIKNL
jgi:hypothetical protein